jgi:replicative DNA helicase
MQTTEPTALGAIRVPCPTAFVAHLRARSLKALANECKVHVLALAQLNDDASRRAKDEWKPCSRDFCESKAIPMNADNVILIHNPWARERAAMFRDGAKVPIPAWSSSS